MAKRKYALELYSVRHDIVDDFLGTLKAVKDMGYEGVEFAGGFPHPADFVAKALKDIGLVCCGWHTPWANVQPDTINATVAYNKTVGNDKIIVPGLPGELTSSLEAWKATAEKFNYIAAKLAPQGMKLGYHNHSAEFMDLGGDTPWNVFMGNTDSSIIMQLDSGNAMSGGADILKVMNDFPGRSEVVHLKPYSYETGFATMVGMDDVPLAEFIKVCEEKCGTQWFIVEYECETLYTPLEGVKLCIQALAKLEKENVI